MAENETTTSVTTDQVAGSGFATTPAAPTGGPTEPQVVPPPSGTVPGTAPGSGTAVARDAQPGVGIDGEVTVWEGRYSMRNFVGRAIGMVLLFIAWATLAIYAYRNSQPNEPLMVLSFLLGFVVLFLGVSLLYRVIMAHYGHYYRLTTRRLFVSSGLFRRRRDMMELLRVQDVYTKQTLFQRWLSLGTVVVVSSDNKLPMAHLPGVEDPKGVMDTVWHYARAERDTKAVKVDHV